MTAIGISDERPNDPRRLRELAAWYRGLRNALVIPSSGRRDCGRQRNWSDKPTSWNLLSRLDTARLCRASICGGDPASCPGFGCLVWRSHDDDRSSSVEDITFHG
jgi:hypothetical protein